MSLTPRQEDVGKRMMELIAVEGQSFTWSDLLILKSAWTGKVRWEEMPDNLREAFFRAAIGITRHVTGLP
jgi:hypothetical protein